MAQLMLKINHNVKRGFRLPHFQRNFGAFIMIIGTVNGIKNLGSWCGKTDNNPRAKSKMITSTMSKNPTLSIYFN